MFQHFPIFSSSLLYLGLSIGYLVPVRVVHGIQIGEVGHLGPALS